MADGNKPTSEEQSPESDASSAAGDYTLQQEEIEALINSESKASSGAGDYALQQQEIEALVNSESAGEGDSESAAGEFSATHTDVELLLNKAQQAIDSIDDPADALPPGVSPFKLEDFSGAPPSREVATLELVRDVQLDLKIELGRTRMHLEDVLRLKRGAVVPLDKLAGDPVDVYVNGRLIARGEVLVLNDNFCVRVTELVAGESAVA